MNHSRSGALSCFEEKHDAYVVTQGSISRTKIYNPGIGWDTTQVDLGRYMVTKNPEDLAAFKKVTLREISHTAM